jgi:hypothetical protein
LNLQDICLSTTSQVDDTFYEWYKDSYRSIHLKLKSLVDYQKIT